MYAFQANSTMLPIELQVYDTIIPFMQAVNDNESHRIVKLYSYHKTDRPIFVIFEDTATKSTTSILFYLNNMSIKFQNRTNITYSCHRNNRLK